MDYRTVRFPKDKSSDFIHTLKSRVNDYFEENNISRNANAGMILKTIFMISLYVIPYIAMVSGIFTSVWVLFILWLIMGAGMAGIGLSVMHDANHGSYSSNRKVNIFLGYLLNFVGGHDVHVNRPVHGRGDCTGDRGQRARARR